MLFEYDRMRFMRVHHILIIWGCGNKSSYTRRVLVYRQNKNQNLILNFCQKNIIFLISRLRKSLSVAEKHAVASSTYTLHMYMWLLLVGLMPLH